MNILPFSRLALIAALFCALCSCQTKTVGVPPEMRDLADSLVRASIDKSYGDFLRICREKGDEAMLRAVAQPGTEAAFQRASGTVSAACGKGYQLSYLGELRQQGHQIYLWKLSGNGAGDDFLVRLAALDGKLSGFFYQ